MKRGRVDGVNRVLSGGPWGGKLVYIPKTGTMVFTVGLHHGHYTGVGEWVSLL